LDYNRDTLCGWTEEKWTMLGGKVDILKILAVARKRALGFTLALVENCTITRAMKLLAT